MSISTSPTLRCPRCSAQVHAGGDWCTLCYADLRPPPPGPPAPVAPVRSAVNDQTSGQPKRRGKHARPAAENLPERSTAAAALADRMLAELATSEAGSPLGAVTTVLDTRGKRVAAGLSAAAAATCVVILLMWAIGALL